MKKLNFSGPILDIKGNPQKDAGTLGELLASILIISTAKPPISAKYFNWALELVKSGIIEMDNVDIKILETFLNEHSGLTVLGRTRLLEVFDLKIE